MRQLDQNKKKIKKSATLYDHVDRKNKALTSQSVKCLIDFDEEYSCSIKSIDIEKNSKIKLTIQFLNGKVLMFSKVSIKSFFYDLIDIFMFLNSEIQKIYAKYKINRCYLDQNLTDTDSTSMFFVFICDLGSNVREDKARNIIFEVTIASQIFDRLDLSADFYEQFNCCNTKLQK